jgi:hypothetical protein
MSLPPPPNPPVEAAYPDLDDEPDRVQWADEELTILEEHLEEFRGKNKAERLELLNTKVVPAMKKIYKGKEWSLRKRVRDYFS